MRWWKTASVGLKVAVIATVVLALSIVGVLAAEQRNSSNQDNAAKARETGTDSDAEAAGDDAKLAANPLELGTVAKVGSSYRVAVTAISLYEGPTEQVIAATLRAEYVGNDDGEPWADLSVEFIGPDSRSHGESDCPAGLGNTDASEQPVLATGDEETYEICIGLPVDDIEGGQVVVEEAFAESRRAFWSTEGAVTKTLPSVAPEQPAAPAPGARYQPRPQPDGRSNPACEDFDEDDYEDYKEWGDQVKKQFRAYRDAGGDDEDKIDDYEEWEETYDKRLDLFEKWDEAC